MLSDRFDDALAFASKLHRDQRRKGADTPYIAHLLSVSALTLEYHGDEECAIAALLHDAVEDQGGTAMAQIIKDRYGARVADIVVECSDRGDDQDTPWHTRKTAYIASIATKSPDAILVTTCDKLHNATAILEDVVAEGLTVFNRFSAPRSDVLWYYRELAEALQNRAPGPLSSRLTKTVAQIEYWVNVSD